MPIHLQGVRILFFVMLLVMPSRVLAQTQSEFQFSCDATMRAALDDRPDSLKFVGLPATEVIKNWKTQPPIAFDGFDADKYGFQRVEFYRWHVPVPEREGAASGDSTEQLALAIHLIRSKDERWFELAPEKGSEEALYIQPRDTPSGDGASEENQQNGSAPKPDDMAGWLELKPATPIQNLPLFRLKYGNNDSGMYQTETFEHQLLLDLRTGKPQIVKALRCSLFEPVGGACSARGEASQRSDTIDCQWDTTLNDFHCTRMAPFGGAYAVRTARKDFHLLSGTSAKASDDSPNGVPDLGQMALQIHDDAKSQTAPVKVAALGPTTLIQRFKDLQHGGEVFVFASAAPESVFDSRFWLVTVESTGKPTVQEIPGWRITGEQRDEEKAAPEFTASLKGYTPTAIDDRYRSRILEQREGFRAFETVLTVHPENLNSPATHVVYWIGIQAEDGKMIANSVRIASDGWTSGTCGDDYHEGTAVSVSRKAGFAEASVKVQGPYEPEYTNPVPPEAPACVWTDLLHWKSGAGFRTHKLAEDCDAAHKLVTITEDGKIQTVAAETATQ